MRAPSDTKYTTSLIRLWTLLSGTCSLLATGFHCPGHILLLPAVESRDFLSSLWIRQGWILQGRATRGNFRAEVPGTQVGFFLSKWWCALLPLLAGLLRINSASWVARTQRVDSLLPLRWPCLFPLSIKFRWMWSCEKRHSFLFGFIGWATLMTELKDVID